jgi:hypothetical protein
MHVQLVADRAPCIDVIHNVSSSVPNVTAGVRRALLSSWRRKAERSLPTPLDKVVATPRTLDPALLDLARVLAR